MIMSSDDYIERLRGRRHRDCTIKHSMVYDRYYCVEHNRWLGRGNCDDPTCYFCVPCPRRPVPLMVMVRNRLEKIMPRML